MSSGTNHNNSTNNGRSSLATSSSDFALPFGSRPNTNSNAGASNHGFFQASSSVPISIPSSPSPSSSFNNHQSHHLLSLSGGIASSPSKSAGLGINTLPSPSARDHANPLAQPHSPTLSLAGEGWPPPPAFTSFPSTASSPGTVTTPAALLRRGPGMNSPGFSLSSPARFRRASMLGREITPFHLDNGSDEEDNTVSGSMDTTQQSAGRRSSNADPDDGDDEMMQMEEDDPQTTSRAPSTPIMGPPTTLFSTPSTPPPQNSSLHQQSQTRPSISALARTSASDSGQDSSSSSSVPGLSSRPVPRSPSSNPSMGSPLGGGNRSRSSSLLSSNVVRKAVTRRGNLLPKDRSMARVAASLQDESKPEDSEIASEAKLQKRLGGEATLPLPRTPRFGPSSSSSATMAGENGSAMRSPFFGATAPAGRGFGGSSRRKYMWDDDVDDIRGVFAADGLDDGESSALSSEEEEEMMMYYSNHNQGDEMGSEIDDDDEDEMRNGVSTVMQDVSSSAAISNDANNGASGSVTVGSVPISTSFGSATTTIGAGGGGGSTVGSLPKRKNNSLWMGFRDKGNAHKWSPGGPTSSSTTLSRRAANANSGMGMGMDLDTSPRVLNPTAARLSKRKTMGDDRYEPYKRRAVSPMNLGSSLGTIPNANPSFTAAANTVQNSNGSNSLLLMPISSPGGGMLYRGIHHHYHHAAAYANRYSTSPTISRPCTPVNSSTSSTTAGGIGGSFSPAANPSVAVATAGTGSGPGYGSGALGLSISANNHHPQSLESRVQLEQQQENEALMDQRVGMLGLS